MLVNI